LARNGFRLDRAKRIDRNSIHSHQPPLRRELILAACQFFEASQDVQVRLQRLCVVSSGTTGFGIPQCSPSILSARPIQLAKSSDILIMAL
jgi:hypothetical protein